MVDANIPSSGELAAILAEMDDEARAEWTEKLDRASTNLGNAAYALSGKLPEAQPDPITWASGWLATGLMQIHFAIDELPKSPSRADPAMNESNSHHAATDE